MTQRGCVWLILVVGSLTVVGLFVVGVVGAVLAVKHGLGW